MGKSANDLAKLYYGLPYHKRSELLADYKAAKISHQRFYNWLKMPNEKLINMPTILKTIVCRRIPKAEAIFKLPNSSVPTLFD